MAVRAPPTCRKPVGEGAKRTRTGPWIWMLMTSGVLSGCLAQTGRRDERRQGITGRPLLHPHRLDVHELPDAHRGELPAVAGALDAAEGEARVGLDDAVDEDVAGLDLGGEGLAAGGIARPDAGAEAEGGAVGELHGVIGV